MGALIVAGVVGAVVGAVLVSAGVWLLRSRRARAAAASPDRQAAARMARDIGVLTEALADRLAAVWKAGGGPPAGDPDSVHRQVLEATAGIMRKAGASEKGAMGVAALTAKKVRPGPIKGPKAS